MKAHPGCALYGPSVAIPGGVGLCVTPPTGAAFGIYQDRQLDGAAIVFEVGNGGVHLAVLCIVARSSTPEDAAAAVVQGAAHVAGELLHSAAQIGGDDDE